MLYIEGDLRLGGTVEGEIEATGDVDIGDEARVKASVAGGHVNIHGQVSGAVTARKRLVVGRTGSLIGDVRVARLVIQEGATFSGNVSMGSPPTQAASGPAARAAEPVPVTESTTAAHPAPVSLPIAEIQPQAVAAPAISTKPTQHVAKVQSATLAKPPQPAARAQSTAGKGDKGKVKSREKPKRR